MADAGYALTWRTLMPYRGVRYHLKEWGRAAEKPRNKEELFNLRHASLRNVIERVFGVAEKRYPILTRMNSWPILTQGQLVMCVMLLHNHIRRSSLFEEDEFWSDDMPEQDEIERLGNILVPAVGGAEETAALNAWRDGIAQQMWTDYQRYQAGV